MSRTLDVSRSGFYSWLKRGDSRRAIEDHELIKEMWEIFIQSDWTYGCPRLHHALKCRGYAVSRKRVARLMKVAVIRPKTQKRRRPRTTDSRHSHPISANLLRRNFRADRPNQVWVSDITYVRTRLGFAYLCVVLDLFSRRIVGWSLKPHMRSSLVEDAVRMALSQRRVEPWSLIFHSDRGSQYACKSFRSLLRRYKIISSMSRKGDCFDNACAESVFGTIKTERIHHREYENFVDARQDLFLYIEGFYNRRRLHSYLGYMSPEEFELTTEAA